MPEPTSPPGRRPRKRAAHLIAGKSQVCANVRVARGELLGEAIVQYGASDPARFEQRVAEVEVKGRGHALRGDKFLVSCRGFGELALLVELVGVLEREWNVIRPRETGTAAAEQQEQKNA